MAVDMFLKLDGIPGESTDAAHKGSIDIASFSWGESNTVSHIGAASGGAAGRVSMQDFHFTAKVSVATPKLMLSCASGSHIKTGVFSVRKAGVEGKENVPFDFLVYKFQGVLITSVQEAGDTSDIPLDSVSFAFQKIDVMFKPISPTGAVGTSTEFAWDLAANKKI
jgi:type VI secretion system secreted protein Hcp